MWNYFYYYLTWNILVLLPQQLDGIVLNLRKISAHRNLANVFLRQSFWNCKTVENKWYSWLISVVKRSVLVCCYLSFDGRDGSRVRSARPQCGSAQTDWKWLRHDGISPMWSFSVFCFLFSVFCCFKNCWFFDIGRSLRILGFSRSLSASRSLQYLQIYIISGRALRLFGASDSAAQRPFSLLIPMQ